MTIKRLFFAVFVAGLVIPAFSQTDVPAKVQKMLSGRPSLSAVFDTTETLTLPGEPKLTTVSKTQLWFRKPNMLLAVSQHTTGTLLTYFDGKTITVHRPSFRAYYSAPQLAGPEPVVQWLEKELGSVSSALFAANPEQTLRQMKPQPMSSQKISGMDFDQVGFVGIVRSELLVAKGDKVLPMIVHERRQEAKSAVLDRFVLINWNVDLDIDPVTFAFNPDADALRVKNQEQVTGEEMPGLSLGMPAPEIKLPLTTGGMLDLASMRGKNIAVLDFFVTKCVGCKSIMTTLTAVSSKYAEAGVKVFPVNVKEKPEAIAKFFAEQGMRAIPVALDSNGSATLAFRVQKVPYTYIVGRDGTVQYVHVGLTPEFHLELERELDRLTTTTIAR